MNNLFQKTNNDKITQFALAHKSLILKATALVSALFILIAISCCVGSSRAKKRLATMEKEMEAEAIAKEKAKFQMANAVISKLSSRAQAAIKIDNIDEFLADASSAALFYRSSIRDGVSLLYLCDKKHYLPSGYAPTDLVQLSSGPTYSVGRSGIYLRREAAVALDTMATEAAREEIKLAVNSAYRSYEYQQTVFARWVQIDGEEEAERESSRPGTSQHQLGTAVDFGSIDESFFYTKECKWLYEHAANYGWSLSFPDGYEDVTGYKWECWHFRYIGIPACRFQKKYFSDIQQFMLEFLDVWVKTYPSQ